MWPPPGRDKASRALQHGGLCWPGVCLDVALRWVGNTVTTVTVRAPEQESRLSGYYSRNLLSDFWRLVLSSGTRALRLASGTGVLMGILGIALAVFVIVARVSGAAEVLGWLGVTVVVLLSTRATLFALGMIAEYVGVAVNIARGRPPSLIVSDPAAGPLGRKPVP